MGVGPAGADMKTKADSRDLALAVSVAAPSPLSRDIIREIAMDIGKAVAAHIETMYPNAVAATSRTMLLSVRNTAFNEIMAALDVIDEEAIRMRLAERKRWRRQHKAAWSAIRKEVG